MSVDHTYNIGKDKRVELYFNIARLDDGSDLISNLSASFYAYDVVTGSPVFTCSISIEELQKLYSHLAKYKILTESEIKETGKFIAIENSTEELINLLLKTKSTELVPALKHLVSSDLSEDDINTILGRKDALSLFHKMLYGSESHSEADWQNFFECNDWIFGYGLNYHYLHILQREAHISRTDLSGSNDVISDFLLSDKRFTKLVELKTPQTPLFKNHQNRSDSWRLSSDLTDAISQILAQKANWEMESINPNFNDNGSRITEGASDVECILIIGSHSLITGSEREIDIKQRTLELYRRNLRNIDIFLYDELYDRAKFIVELKARTNSIKQDNQHVK